MDATTAVSSYFPQELISGILSQLPVKALLRFLCVLKQWNSIIADPDFMKIHLKCSIENNRDRTIIINDQISLMMPKCSPVRYTIPTLEQPVPENKKVQRNAFQGGPVWSRPNTLRRLSQKTFLQL